MKCGYLVFKTLKTKNLISGSDKGVLEVDSLKMSVSVGKLNTSGEDTKEQEQNTKIYN